MADGDFDVDWDSLNLDEDFVRSARITERSGELRIEHARRSRELAERLDEERRVAVAREGSERRRVARRRAVALFTIVCFVGGGVALFVRRSGTIADSDLAKLGLWSADRPPRSNESRSKPLGTPQAPEVTSDSYAFSMTQPTSRDPVTYDPCRPIHYVVNEAKAPTGTEGLVAEAVAELSRATGLQFIFDGTTTEVSNNERLAFQPNRYGQRWAPVLIDWTDPASVRQLAGATVGVGGSQAIQLTDILGEPFRMYVTGSIALDTPGFAEILQNVNRPGFDARATTRAIVEHELGHLVGLAHVDDPTQLMFPTTASITDYQAGDRTGLARLGKGACHPEV